MTSSGLVLTPRDLGLLHDCYWHIQLSFAQVHYRHFVGRSRPTVANRLAALRREGLLTVHHLGRVLYQHRGRHVGAVYQVARRGLRQLQASFPNERFREEPIPLNHASLFHDLLLTDVMTALEKARPTWRLTHGRLAEGAPGRRGRVPDATANDLASGGKVAIELELTSKSERRYREIILQYRTNPAYRKVAYVVAGHAIESKIRGIIAGRKQLPGLPLSDTGKFEFIPLESLIQESHLENAAHQTSA